MKPTTPTDLAAVIAELKELLAGIPPLRADWRGTNHYELTTSGTRDYWWLDVAESVFGDMPDEREDGQRMGRVLDVFALLTQHPEIVELVEAGAKLPKDAEGKPIVPGSTVACPSGHPIQVPGMPKLIACPHDDCYEDTIGDKGQVRYPLSMTRSAALAATTAGEVEGGE